MSASLEVRAHVRLADLGVAALSHNNRPKLMSVLSAYLDESYGHSVLTVAGWVADAEKWGRFHDSWSARLRREHLDVLGSSDILNAKAAPFRDWSPEKRAAILAECVADIGADAIASIEVSILFDDFNAALESEGIECAETKHRNQNCYALCGIACIGVLAEWVKAHAPAYTQIAVTFESGMRGFGKIERYLRHMQKKQADSRAVRLISPPPSKVEVIELQAADFFAGACMRHVSRISGNATAELPTPRGLLDDLFRSFVGRGPSGENVLGGYWDRARVLDRLRKMTQHDDDSGFNRALLLGYDADDDDEAVSKQ